MQLPSRRPSSPTLVDPDALRAARNETVTRESQRNLRIGGLVVGGVMLIEGVGHVFQTPERPDLIVYPLVCSLICAAIGAVARRRDLPHPEWWFLVPWLAGLGTTIQHISHEPTGAVMFLAAVVMVVAALVLGTAPLIIALSVTSLTFTYAVEQTFDSYQWLYPAVTLPLAGLILTMRRARLKESDRRVLAERALATQQAELEGLRRSRALAEGVAHHFNNLLMVILSHGSIALEDAPEQSALSEDLDAVVQAGQRAVELVHGLVVTTGAGPANIRRVSVEAILGDLPLERDVTVVCELPGEATVTADLNSCAPRSSRCWRMRSRSRPPTRTSCFG
ncbi:MAG: hypothetical protein AB8I08_20220 [Sandaracinaceae bacterium]